MSSTTLSSILAVLSLLLSTCQNLPVDPCEADCVRNDNQEEQRWLFDDTDIAVSTETVFCRYKCRINRNNDSLSSLFNSVAELQKAIADNSDNYEIVSLTVAALSLVLAAVASLQQLCQNRRLRPRSSSRRQTQSAGRLHLYRQPTADNRRVNQ